MKNSIAMLREAGSFVAGLLIGLSIAVPVSAMLMAEPDGWQILWIVWAAVILCFGLILQLLVTAKPRCLPNAKPIALLAKFVKSGHST